MPLFNGVIADNRALFQLLHVEFQAFHHDFVDALNDFALGFPVLFRQFSIGANFVGQMVNVVGHGRGIFE